MHIQSLTKCFGLSIFFAANICNADAQSTYTVNNTIGSTADYHLLQHALDSVPAGSIILLQNSGLNYGKANINKPVVIYGAGYFLGQNAAPATQANTAESMVSYLGFNAGSQGSIVSGLHIKDSSNDGSIINYRVSFNNTSNVTLSRCLIEPAVAYSYNYGGAAATFNASSNITVEQCYIKPPGGGLLSLTSSTSILFTNNLVISGQNTLNFQSGSSINSTCTLKNNTFYGSLPSGFRAAQCVLFENNIVIITDTASHPNSNSGLWNDPFSNADHNVTNAINLFEYDAMADNTNIIDVNLNIDSVFLHYSNQLISSNDGIYQLKPNSIAKNAGNDGTDAGAYGSSLPYALSGIPSIPYAYSITVPSQGAGTISVHIKAKATN